MSTPSVKSVYVKLLSYPSEDTFSAQHSLRYFGRSFTLGKGPECDLQLPLFKEDGFMKLQASANQVAIMDSSFEYVNREGGQLISNGGILEVGPYTLFFGIVETPKKPKASAKVLEPEVLVEDSFEEKGEGGHYMLLDDFSGGSYDLRYQGEKKARESMLNLERIEALLDEIDMELAIESLEPWQKALSFLFLDRYRFSSYRKKHHTALLKIRGLVSDMKRKFRQQRNALDGD